MTAETREEFVIRHLEKGGWWRFRGDEMKAAFRLVVKGSVRWRARHRPVEGFVHTVAFEFAGRR